PAVVGALVLLFFVVIALAAPLIAPATMLDVTQQLEAPRYAPPSLDHPLGTDGLGRELWVRILWGARVSILVGVAATVLSLVIAIGLTSWASTARIVRSQTLSVESRLYIERARILGAGHRHILFRHLLPAVMPLVLANTTLTVGGAIIAESTLSFLGLGDTSKESWGTILKNSMDVSAATSGYWWYVLTPGIAILLVVLAFTMVGRALEAIINPALRSR